MCSLLTLWEVGHVFLCACVMLTCHFRPFCCLPLNTVQCNNTVLIGLEQHIRLLWCLKICKHITIFCSTYQQKHKKKNLTFFFPKKSRTQLNQMRQKVSHFIYLRMTDRRIWICFLYHLGPRSSQMSARTGAKHFQ